MVRISDKTTPFFVKLSSDGPLPIDRYYKITDSDKKTSVLCRIIETSAVSKEDTVYYEATAKIESSVLAPINPNGEVTLATFKDLKPVVFKSEPENGLIIGQIQGTETDCTVGKYKDIMPMFDGVEKKFYKQEGIPCIFPYKQMIESPHIGIFGGSGSGKTYALKVIIEELIKKQLPLIIFDPHLEMGFSGKVDALPARFKYDFSDKTEIFRVGEDIGINFCELSTSELINIMSFSGELSGPMIALLTALHSPGEGFVSLTEKIESLISVLDKKDRCQELNQQEQRLYILYGAKVSSPSVLTALNWRLSSLGSSNIFIKTAEPIMKALLKKKACVIRGSLEIVNIFASYILEKTYKKRRDYVDNKELGLNREYFPPFFICTDESHLLCPRDNSSLCKKILKTIAQEGRKYGVMEIFATQRPALLDVTVTAQLATKFIFRLGNKEDIDTVRKETDLSPEEIKRLPFMSSGDNYMSSPIFGKTIYTRFRAITSSAKINENPFDEFIENIDEETKKIQDFILTKLPINCLNLSSIIPEIKTKFNVSMTVPEFTKLLDNMADKGMLLSDKTAMGTAWLPTD